LKLLIKNKVSKEFLESCEKESKLFKQSKKEESQGRDLPPAQPHDTRYKELCETRERKVGKES
jgi:hypothetical protein